MKRLLISLCSLCFGISILLAQADKDIMILQTSDTHSCIEPDPKTGQGGYVRRAVFVNQMRKADPDLLLVDCGDFCQGSLYFNLFKGETEVVLMNELGYDVATLGNHEFDYGMENMERILRMANFPIVCTNYDFSHTSMYDLIRPYYIMERKGIRMGFVGVGPQLEGLVLEKNYEGIIDNDPIATADSMAMVLKEKKGCDVVICLSHLGWQSKHGVNDERFIQETHHIDVVLGGHSHSYFEKPAVYTNADGREVKLMHTGKSGRYVGEMHLLFTKE